MDSKQRDGERRRWHRIPIALPVFIRGRDDEGQNFMEFTTALNISAGGALVIIRHDQVSARTRLSVEIPAAPLPEPGSFRRQLNGELVRVESLLGWAICGLQFAIPLLEKERG
jgi:hypothetical protein